LVTSIIIIIDDNQQSATETTVQEQPIIIDTYIAREVGQMENKTKLKLPEIRTHSISNCKRLN
jgi:hypothetical protein